MNYQQFVESGYYQNLDGKEDLKASFYKFPLIFDVSEELVESIKYY
jgi:hypothetical protein